MNEHNIDNFMKLITNRKGTAEHESESDRYYRGVYERIASGEKRCWNWSAALLGPVWLLYRKMFKYYFLYLGTLFFCAIAMVASLLSLAAVFKTSEILLVFFTVATMAMLFILIPGFFGNWFYVRHIHQKIDKGYHLCALGNTSSFLAWMSFLIPYVNIFFIPFVAWNDKQKLKQALSAQALAEQGGVLTSNE